MRRGRVVTVYVGEVVDHAHEEQLVAAAEEDAADHRYHGGHGGPDSPAEPEQANDHAAWTVVSTKALAVS